MYTLIFAKLKQNGLTERASYGRTKVNSFCFVLKVILCYITYVAVLSLTISCTFLATLNLLMQNSFSDTMLT